MNKFFSYTREASVKKVDANGQPVLLRSENGDVIPGKFETEVVSLKDSFNLSKVIRVHMLAADHVIVLLDDGHESTEKTPELKNPNKRATPDNIHEVKTRVWLQSELSVRGGDVDRLFAALEN